MKNLKLITTVCIAAFICTGLSCKSEKERRWETSAMATKLFELEERGWKANQLMHFAKDIQYRATEVPIEYYLLKNQGLENVQTFDSIALANSSERIIEFEFEHLAQSDLLLEEYTQKNYDNAVTYMAGTIQNDFVVVTSSNDTISCAGVHFERHFKVSPFKRVLLYFEGIDPNESIRLVYKDELFRNGNFEFDFGKALLKL